jgi:hypothetical protein
MALTVPTLYQALLASRFSGGFPFAGVPYDALALGIASGVVQWGIGQPTNLALTGWATGIAGAGTIPAVSSRLLIPSTASVVVAALSGAGMKGPLSLSLATAVAMGIAQGFTASGQYWGTVAGVGTGILESTLRSSLGSGLATSMMTQGLGNGIASLLLQGTGTASVVGVVSGGPASGTTNSVVT